jgi:hypothetical protein
MTASSPLERSWRRVARLHRPGVARRRPTLERAAAARAQAVPKVRRSAARAVTGGWSGNGGSGGTSASGSGSQQMQCLEPGELDCSDAALCCEGSMCITDGVQIACAALCSAGDECQSGCCAAVDELNSVCAPATFCRPSRQRRTVESRHQEHLARRRDRSRLPLRRARAKRSVARWRRRASRILRCNTRWCCGATVDSDGSASAGAATSAPGAAHDGCVPPWRSPEKRKPPRG